MTNGAGEVLRDFFDINGDGLPDAIDTCGADDPPHVWTVHLNSGFDFAPAATPWAAPGGSHFVRDSSFTRTVRDSFDIDGDGLVDFVDSQTNDAAGELLIFRSAAGAWCATSSSGTTCGVSGGAEVAPNPKAGKPYLLTQIRNGVGGTTLLDYRPSTDSTHEISGVPQLPFAVWTVTAITQQDEVCDGLSCPGHELRAEFTYDHGKYDSATREFRGFGTVERRDANDGVRQTFFHQDVARKGKIKRVIDGLHCPPDDFCQMPVHQTLFDWECADLLSQPLPGGCPSQLAGRIWPRLKNTTETSFSNFTWILYKSKQTTNVSWDQCQGEYFGNVGHVQVSKAGESAIVDTYTEYACTAPNDMNAYIVDKPKHALSKSGSNTLEEKWFLYDDQATLGQIGPPARGNVTKVFSYANRTDRIVDGNLQSCPAGGGSCVVTTTQYNGVGNVTVARDAQNNATSTTYDATQIYAFEVTNPAGHKVAMTYDPKCGKMLTQTIPYTTGTPESQPQLRNAYDEFCRLKRSARPDEDLVTSPGTAYCYALGGAETPTVARVLQREPNFCPGCSSNWAAVFDNCGDPNPSLPTGYVPTWAMADALGRPLQQQTMRVVDGALTTVVTGAVEYDTVGRVATSYAPFSDAAALGTWSDPLEADPEEAGTTVFQYDSIGRVIATTNPALKTRTVSYATAWQTTIQDECFNDSSCTGGKVVEISDALGRVLERHLFEEATLKAMTRFTYDGIGKLLTTEQWNGTDWDSKTKITMEYDTLGRKVSMNDPDTGPPEATAKGEWKYWYDARGNLRVQEDPKSDQHLQFCYDNLNRSRRKYIFDSTDYVESGAGANLVNRSSPTNEPAKVVAYEYDGVQSGQSQTIANAVGQLTFVSDPSGKTFFDDFDVRGRLRDYRKRLLVGTTLEQARFQYSYVSDHLDVITYPDLEQVRVGYDETGQARSLKSLTYSGSSSIYVADLTYDRLGRPRQISHGNTSSSHQVNGAVVAETREYWDKDKNFSLKSITVAHSTGTGTAPVCGSTTSNGPYLQLTYNDYTPTGLLKSVTDLHQSCSILSNQATYTYDGLGRLYDVTGSQFDGSYRYNELGNMTVINGATLTYGNSYRPHQLTYAYGQNIFYDANGNREDSGANGYEFDEDDRLISVNSGAVDVMYDYSGRKVLQQTGSSAPMRYFDALAEYDGAMTRLRKHYFIGSMRIASRENAWGPTVIASSGWPTVMVASLPQGGPGVVLFLDERAQRALGLTMVATLLCLMMIPGRRRQVAGIRVHPHQAALMALLWTLGTLPVPLLLLPLSARTAMASGGGSPSAPYEYYHYHGDHLGSTQLLTDPTGKVKSHIRYVPFGELRGRYKADLASGAPSKRFEFTGYEIEGVSGLHYASARFYESKLGMFLTHDPARQYANPYTYTNGNPINRTDPTGAYDVVTPAIIVGVAIVAAGIVAAGIDAYVKTGDIGAAAKASATANASVIAGPLNPGLQLVAPDEFGRLNARDWAIGQIPVAGSAYGAARAFEEGYYASGIVGVVAAVYQAYGVYQSGNWSTPGQAVKSVANAVATPFVGENFGELWRDTISDWVAGRWGKTTGIDVPKSLADAINGVEYPANARRNGYGAWHAGTNALLARKLGIVGAPLVFLGGVFHETPLDRDSFRYEYRTQGAVNHILDSTHDIVANLFGLQLGYAKLNAPTSALVKNVAFWANYIPGPDGGGENYTGNPSDRWGRYP